MRIFSHWTRIEKNVEIGGVRQRLHAYGGSDQSVAAAARDAEQRLARVLERIRTGKRKDESYEADIREEIIQRVDAGNVVTRNRYGACVLNSANVVFVDMDEPRFTFREIFFGRERNLARRKERIVAFVRKRAASAEYRGLGFRLYETHKGIRAIVTGGEFEPRAPATRKLLRGFDADHLYTLLCAKQGCFRARLTPKPHRMKCPTHRVVFPRLDGRSEHAFQTWLAEYEARRANFAVCRFIGTIGPEYRNAVIDYHDRQTGAFSGRKLA